MGWTGILFKTRVPLGTDSSCNTISSCFAFSVLLAVASSPTPLLSVYHYLERVHMVLLLKGSAAAVSYHLGGVLRVLHLSTAHRPGLALRMRTRGPIRASRRRRFTDFCDFQIEPADFLSRDSDFSRDFLAYFSYAHARKVYCAC